MDLDPDSFDIETHVVETVELDDHATINPSLLGYDGTADHRRSFSPATSLILPNGNSRGLTSGTLGPAFMSPGSAESNGFTFPHSLSPPPQPSVPLVQQPYTISVVIPPPRYIPLQYSTSRSGLVYDVRMRFHQDLTGSHPENPARIYEVYNELIAGGLYSPDPSTANENQLVRIPIRHATIGEICLVHTHEHVDFVRGLAARDSNYLYALTSEKGESESVYYHPHTWEAATLAAGGAIEATRAVVGGLVRNAIAVIRPPGHHAEHDSAKGFCFFNNVCVAAKVVQQEFPHLCRKILILDWDVHHGNGVQQAFYDDPNVLYISLHVYDNGKMYPHGDYGDHVHCGEGLGLGRNVNIPWPANGMNDTDYLYAFQQVVMPVALEFNPDLVLISAGFDAADGDSIGGCHLSPAGYGHMTHMLMQLAQGKVVACLEGGYGSSTGDSEARREIWNARPVARSALAVTRTLMGEPPDRLGDSMLSDHAIRTVTTVIRTQSRFWKCLYPKSLDIQRKKELGGERLHDIIREWQSIRLFDEFRMSELFVGQPRISKSFQNHVLATPNYNEARPLLVIFHDPPEALGIPDPKTSKLELHNTWLTDVSKTYVEWACKNDFAVMDVNVPKYLTGEEDDTGYDEADNEAKRSETTRIAANYLWSNYIELSDATHLFFLGIGDAYAGIIKLLGENRHAFETIDHTFAFVAENLLRRIDHQGEDSAQLANRFYRRSSIYVTEAHQAVRENKLKKRHGTVKVSPALTLQDMLARHRGEVTQKMLDLTEQWRDSRVASGGKLGEGVEVAESGNGAPGFAIGSVDGGGNGFVLDEGAVVVGGVADPLSHLEFGRADGAGF